VRQNFNDHVDGLDLQIELGEIFVTRPQRLSKATIERAASRQRRSGSIRSKATPHGAAASE
jgi:hypothetical protein